MQDWTFPGDPDYLDRPGLSPTLASLRAARVVRSADRVLEVGCGTGLDSVGLAASGVREVVGIDAREAALRVARRRAQMAGVADRASFQRLRVEHVPRRLAQGSFDVVVDTLLGSNLRDQDRYAESVAHALRPRGLFVATYKVGRAEAAILPEFEPGGPFARRFEVRGQVATQLPTRTFGQRRSFLDVVTVVARRRG